MITQNDLHPDGMVDGPCHTDNPKEYRCNKCGDTFAVKHIGQTTYYYKVSTSPNKMAK